MRFVSVGACAAALATICAVSVAGAPSSPLPTSVKAAADATRAAKKVTLEARNGSSVTGDVSIYVIGRSKTRIVVRIPTTGKYRLFLHPGSDCSNNREAASADVALAPTNFNQSRASMSSTIVSLPLEKVRSNYVVDVRDATSAASLAEACAKLNR